MLQYKRAFERTSQGKTTGPGSRLLSWLVLNLYVLATVYLVDNRLYLPLGIVILLAFTPLAPLGILALGLYLLYIRLWPGFLLVLLIWIAGFASVRLGVRYNERRIRARGALVDPIETMPEIVPATVLQLAAFALALLLQGLLSILFWLISAGTALFLVWRFAFRLRAKWARLHYPLLLRYSALAGEETAKAILHGREYSMLNNIPPFLRSVYPDRTEQELSEISASAEQKLAEFSDETSLREYFRARSSDPNKIDVALSSLKSEIQLRKDWDSKYLRYLIAEIVTRDFGHTERIKYLAALLTGDAS